MYPKCLSLSMNRKAQKNHYILLNPMLYADKGHLLQVSNIA